MNRNYSISAVKFLLKALSFLAPLIFSTRLNRDVFVLPKQSLIDTTASIISIFSPLTKKERKINGLLPVILSWILSWVSSPKKRLAFWGSHMRQTGLIQETSNFIIAKASTIHRIDWFWNLFAGFIVAVYAIMQYFKKDPIRWGIKDRPSSTIGSADFYPHYLIMLIPIAITKLLSAKFWEQKLAWLFYIATMSFATLISRTRGAIAGFLLSVPITLLLQNKDTIKRNKGLLTIGSFVLAIFAFIKRKWLMSFIKRDYNAMNIRFSIWKDSLKVVGKRPLFGYGNDAIRNTISKVRTPETLKMEPNIGFDRTHNQFIDELVMRGSIGLLSYIYLLARALFKGVRNKDVSIRTLVASIIAFLTQNAVSFNTSITALTFWQMIGQIYHDS